MENHHLQGDGIETALSPNRDDGRSERPAWRRPTVTRITLEETLIAGGSFNDGPFFTSSPN